VKILIDKFIIFILILLTLITKEIYSTSNSKIVFEIKGKYYSTIDIENRQKYLQLVSSNKNISYETAKKDLKSVILFNQFYLENNLKNVNEEELFVLLFNRYLNNQTEDYFQKIYNNFEKKNILKNIKYDIQRKNIIEKNIQMKKFKIFENLETYNLLIYNYIVDYYIFSIESYNKLLNKNFKFDELNTNYLNEILINNNIKYLYKNKEVNDFSNLDNELKNYITNGKSTSLKKDKNVTIIIINKLLKSKEKVKFIINELTSKEKISESDLKCERYNNLAKDDKILSNKKTYDVKKLNNQIVDNLTKIDDFLVFQSNNSYKYFVLCGYELDNNYFKDMTVGERINYFAELIEIDFVNYYTKYYLLNELQ